MQRWLVQGTTSAAAAATVATATSGLRATIAGASAVAGTVAPAARPTGLAR